LNDEAPLLKLEGVAVDEVPDEVLDEAVDEAVNEAGAVVVATADTLLAVEPLAVVEAMVVEGVVCAPTEKSPV
jgi:hypothetical protein